LTDNILSINQQVKVVPLYHLGKIFKVSLSFELFILSIQIYYSRSRNQLS